MSPTEVELVGLLVWFYVVGLVSAAGTLSDWPANGKWACYVFLWPLLLPWLVIKGGKV